MKPERKADIVFVIDASDSMVPYFQKLKEHLRRFIEPVLRLQEVFATIRLGLLAYKAGGKEGHAIYEFNFISGNQPDLVKGLYTDTVDSSKYFTNDPAVFIDALDNVRTQGDENTPLALDMAGDFPFAPLNLTVRAIILFTDKIIENGILKEKAVTDKEPYDLIDKIMVKIWRRHIALFLFAPMSNALAECVRAPRTYAVEVPRDDLDCDLWRCWEKISSLAGIAIKGETTIDEPSYQRAIYKQNEWPMKAWDGSQLL
jgi:hypothetical protein